MFLHWLISFFFCFASPFFSQSTRFWSLTLWRHSCIFLRHSYSTYIYYYTLRTSICSTLYVHRALLRTYSTYMYFLPIYVLWYIYVQILRKVFIHTLKVFFHGWKYFFTVESIFSVFTSIFSYFRKYFFVVEIIFSRLKVFFLFLRVILNVIRVFFCGSKYFFCF